MTNFQLLNSNFFSYVAQIDGHVSHCYGEVTRRVDVDIPKIRLGGYSWVESAP